MEVKNYFATDTQGNVLGSAQVYLYLAGTTTLATGLQNISGAALGNPFTSDSNGLVQFKAPDNNYDLRVVKPGREFTIRIQCFDGIAFFTSLLNMADPSKGLGSIGYYAGRDGSLGRTAQNKASDFASIKDFGAICDGTLHTVAEWIKPGTIAWAGSLAEVQAKYPHVSSLSDSVDWVAWVAGMNWARLAQGELDITGELVVDRGLKIPSGTINVRRRSGYIKFPAGVAVGIEVGDPGSNPWRGELYSISLRKDLQETGDIGIKLVNAVEFGIWVPKCINFESGISHAPRLNSRVSYGDVYNPIIQGHAFGVTLRPEDNTSYANECQYTGGRLASYTAGKLQYQILLDGSTSTGVQHNIFRGMSLEGYSGGGACGKSAVKAIGGADSNIFENNRTEQYGTGWSEKTYQFDESTYLNEYGDNRTDTTIDDRGANSYRFPNLGHKINDSKSVSPNKSMLTLIRRSAVTTTGTFLLDLYDTYSNSGKVGGISYQTPRQEGGAGAMLRLTSGYGDVLVVTDNGDLLPVNNRAKLGSATKKYNGAFLILPTYATNAAALAGGLVADQMYKTATGEVRIVV